jgi:hypothetical protein
MGSERPVENEPFVDVEDGPPMPYAGAVPRGATRPVW